MCSLFFQKNLNVFHVMLSLYHKWKSQCIMELKPSSCSLQVAELGLVPGSVWYLSQGFPLISQFHRKNYYMTLRKLLPGKICKYVGMIIFFTNINVNSNMVLKEFWPFWSLKKSKLYTVAQFFLLFLLEYSEKDTNHKYSLKTLQR